MIRQKEFSFKRFGMLFKKHTVENLRAYAMSVFVMASIVTVTMGLASFGRPVPIPVELQEVFFISFLLGSGTIFTSTVFVNLGDKRRTIAALMLPATAFEKFLVAWIYSFVVFIVLYSGLFYGVIMILLHIKHWEGQHVEVLNIFSVRNRFVYVFLIYSVLHAIAFYGAVFFKKMHFIKTAFVFFVCIAVICYLNSAMLQLMLHTHVASNPPFSGAVFDENGQISAIGMGDDRLKWMMSVCVFLTVAFWTATYYRLKEKQA